MGPSVACLLMEYLEALVLAEYEHSTPILYKRHNDNTVGAASCTEKELQCFIDHVTNFNPSIKYTYNISNKTVTFLDLQLKIDNNHIKSCVRLKLTDSHNYLLFSSSHPPSCKHSIFTNVGNQSIIQTMMMSLRSQIKSEITFLHANTPSVSLNQPTKIFTQFTERPSSKMDSPDHIPLIVPFHPSIYPLHRITLKHYKTLMTDQDTKDILN